MLSWQCLLIFIFSSSHLYYLNTHAIFILAMSLNMYLIVYVIPCILSYDFNKLPILYIHVHISLTFFLSIKYLFLCLSVGCTFFYLCKKTIFGGGELQANFLYVSLKNGYIRFCCISYQFCKCTICWFILVNILKIESNARSSGHTCGD